MHPLEGEGSRVRRLDNRNKGQDIRFFQEKNFKPRALCSLGCECERAR